MAGLYRGSSAVFPRRLSPIRASKVEQATTFFQRYISTGVGQREVTEAREHSRLCACL